MAGISPDVVISAFNDLEKGYTTTFDSYNPVFDKILQRTPAKKVKSKFHEWTLTPEGPGTINILQDADQEIEGGRRQSSVRARAYVPTIIYAWDVPYQDFRDMSSEADLADLIRTYPDRGLLELQEILAEQFVMGNRAEVNAFPTLNGDATYDPRGFGAESGFLAFAPIASQTGTVHGVARNSIPGWANQYRHITSFQANGRKQLRAAHSDASSAVRAQSGALDCLIADALTFDNYVEDLDDMTLIMNKSPSGTGDMNKGAREGVPFLQGGATMYREHHIDLTQFTTPNAQLGVCYGIHSDYLKMLSQGADPAKETDGKFALRHVGRIPVKEVERWEYIVAMAPYVSSLRQHFAVTGGAQV